MPVANEQANCRRRADAIVLSELLQPSMIVIADTQREYPILHELDCTDFVSTCKLSPSQLWGPLSAFGGANHGWVCIDRAAVTQGTN